MFKNPFDNQRKIENQKIAKGVACRFLQISTFCIFIAFSFIILVLSSGPTLLKKKGYYLFFLIIDLKAFCGFKTNSNKLCDCFDRNT